jgi:protein-S-isoprenylcysteine O-methyltransferase Ste14
MSIESFLTPQVISSTGAIPIALYLAYLLWKIVTNHEKHFSQVMTKNTETLTELTYAIQDLKEHMRKRK